MAGEASGIVRMRTGVNAGLNGAAGAGGFQITDSAEERQTGGTDVGAYAAFDAAFEAVVSGEIHVAALGGFEKAGGLDAGRAALDAPGTADAGIGHGGKLPRHDMEDQLAAGDDGIGRDVVFAEDAAAAEGDFIGGGFALM